MEVLHPWPEAIFIFDINGTLSFNIDNLGLVPAHIAFPILRRDMRAWVGVCSGMYRWMQLQEMTDGNVAPDFIIMKAEFPDLIKSIERIYKQEFTGKTVWIGDQEEDRNYAKSYGCEYFTPAQFTKKYLIDEGHIPRPTTA